MDADGKGYISDVEYVPGFYPYMAPLAMQHVAAINRFAPPASKPSFRYLELGTGFGRCLTTLAAANAHAEFVGVDFNPKHTAHVAADIEAGGLTNARIITASFDELPDDIGEFDFIAIHGVYSWVSANVRDAILKLVERRLAKGGLLLVSYNAMPGWAALQPVRAILQQYAMRRSGDSLQRINDALQYLTYIRKNKAKYFEDNPSVCDRVDTFLRQNRRYLAHEYLNENWSTFYFHEVARDFKKAGLEFIGNLPLHENFWDLCVGPEFKELFSTTKDRCVIETHKDFCTNTAFRWDVYARDPEPMLTLHDRLQKAGQFYFRLAFTDTKFPFTATFGAVTANAQGPVYEQLSSLLLMKGMTLQEILTAKDWGAITPEEIINALDIGACMNIFEVEATAVARGKRLRPTDKLTLNNKFNRHMLANNILTGRSVALASELTGTGHSITDFNALILHELIERGYENLAERLVAQLEKAGRNLKRGGVVITNNEEKLTVVKQVYDAFFATQLPLLVDMGIVKEAE